MKFDAAILTDVYRPLVVETIELDAPLRSGQVLVQVPDATQVCVVHKLWNNADAAERTSICLHLLGHEAFGVVC